MKNENVDRQERTGEQIIDAGDDAEILTDGGVTVEKTPPMKTPKETKEEIEGIGALAQAETYWENTLEVLGTVGQEEPKVSISLGNAGNIHDASVVISFPPDKARELADALQRRADYAEDYTEHKRKEQEE